MSQAQILLEEAVAYARDRKAECRQEAARSQDKYYDLGMANAFAEMSEYLYRILTENRVAK